MRIVYVSKWFPPEGGGIGTYVGTMYDELKARGHEPIVVTSTKHGTARSADVLLVNSPDKLAALGRMPYLWRHAKSIACLVYSFRVWRTLAALSPPPDVVEFVDRDAEGFIYGLAGKRIAPMVVHVHFPSVLGDRYYGSRTDPWLAAMEQRQFQAADAIVSPSAYVAEELQRAYNVDNTACQVIPYPIVARKFPCATRSEKGSDPVRLLFASSLVPEKGVFVLLEALSTIVPRVPDIKLVIAGRSVALRDGNSIDLIQREVAARNLENRVQVLGEVARSDMPRLMQDADIFVLPSFYDTFANAVLEAQVCGVPVITTRVGGLGEIVHDGVTGLLCEPRDSAGLAQAIVQLAQNDALRREMGENARARVLNLFDADRTVPARIALYQKLARARAETMRS